jgi:hypothetical protein
MSISGALLAAWWQGSAVPDNVDSNEKMSKEGESLI